MKYKGKFEKLCESTLNRYELGGFLTGDYVKIKSDALSNDKVKLMSEQMKAQIKLAMEGATNLKLSYIKSTKAGSAVHTVGESEKPGELWADIYVEYAPGMWKDPMTLPVEVLEKVQIDAIQGYPEVPDGIKRDNVVEAEGTSTEDMVDSPTPDFKANHNMADSNTKLAHTPEPKSGDGVKMVSEKKQKTYVTNVELIAEAYESMYNK